MPSNEEVGERITAARLRHRYSVQAAAAASGISRDTWRKIEAGRSVHDTKRQAALDLLGLNVDGLTVGAPTQDASPGYVSAPGERVEGDSEDKVLGAIEQMRRDVLAMGERLEANDRALSERLDRLEGGA